MRRLRQLDGSGRSTLMLCSGRWSRQRPGAVRGGLGRDTGGESPGALTELPQPQALALAYFGGYTQREIADLTSVPVGTVKSRIFAAMRLLQLRLTEEVPS